MAQVTVSNGAIDNAITQIERLIDRLEDPDPMLEAVALDLLQTLERNAPMGATGNLRKGLLQYRLYQNGSIKGVGIGDPVILGDPTLKAPSGTIRDFIHWMKTQKGRADPGYAAATPTPLAWWHLSREQKQQLQAQREQGRFGGQPGLAPYWYVQEAGEPKAQVAAQNYIQRSIEEWRGRFQLAVRAWIRTG